MEDWQRKYLLSKMQGNPILNQFNNMPNQQQSAPSFSQYDELTANQHNRLPTKPCNTCSIRPGSMLYRSIDANGFGTTAIFVVPAGQAPEDFALKEFEYKQEQSSCVLVENQMQVIDAGKIDEKKTLRLIRVSSPFVGSFFIQESNIIFNLKYNQDNGRKAILRG